MFDFSTLVYELPDGRLWDVAEARYVDAIPDGKQAKALTLSEPGKDAEQCLVETLLFYQYPLGAFADTTVAGILMQLKALDEWYLTPRVLAGLALGDKYAYQQWQLHEEVAAPLRKRLAGLAGTSVSEQG